MHNCILNVLYKRQALISFFKRKFYGLVKPDFYTHYFEFDNHVFRVLLLLTKTLTKM